jgi:hypothetical protein
MNKSVSVPSTRAITQRYHQLQVLRQLVKQAESADRLRDECDLPEIIRCGPQSHFFQLSAGRVWSFPALLSLTRLF